ncbi:hypothetical protein [Lutispora sp.]|uniref:hypothetical protein n=1 Tax=Lutispora sp. TaxID=2828727 RepID=UPI002B1FBF69|nr:hypothetical protein [Lutispora sp.]MEA4963166.1 hypothetical protein [Lutispora sp.]
MPENLSNIKEAVKTQLIHKTDNVEELKPMELNFVKLSPAENTTVLVTNYVDSNNYPEVVSKIITYTHINAEQVGFIKKPNGKEAILRLEMPAGEFCGDGIMSAAALVSWLGYSDKMEFSLESSGLNSLVHCSVKKIQNNLYKVKAYMPIEYQIIDYQSTFRNHKIIGKLVSLPGITHLILEAGLNQYEAEFISELVKHIAAEIKAKAIGVIPYSASSTEVNINPCIHVPKTGKLLFERGCGSGSLAVGLCLAQKHKKSINTSIKQPGGVIRVGIDVQNSCSEPIKIEMAFLETDILITCGGKLYI